MPETDPNRDHVGVATQIKRFPRGRTFWRLFFSTEQAMGRLPVVISTSAIAAVAGTAWVISHPSTQHVRHGVVIGTDSFWHVLISALVGGALAVVVVCGFLFIGAWIYLRIVLPIFGWSDTWEPTWEHHFVSGTVRFTLVCRAFPPKSVESLGHMECAVKRPNGRIQLIPDILISQWEIPVEGNPRTRQISAPAAYTDINLQGESGRYKVRWYGTVRRRYEIARAEFEIEAPTQQEPPQSALDSTQSSTEKGL